MGGTARQRDGLGWPDDTVSRDKRREWGGGELEISRLLQCTDGGESVDETYLLPVGLGHCAGPEIGHLDGNAWTVALTTTLAL
jgi:hypothetical protein